jgi:uncharacterized integral membrane protein
VHVDPAPKPAQRPSAGVGSAHSGNDDIPEVPATPAHIQEDVVSVLHRSRSAEADAAATEPPPVENVIAAPEHIQAEGVAGRPQPPPATPVQPSPGLDRRGRVRRTRAGGIWIGLIATAVVLVLLLIFVLQNSRTVAIHFLGLSGHLSLAVALLLAAVAGLLLIAIPGTARIMQLRRSLKKTHNPGANRAT